MNLAELTIPGARLSRLEEPWRKPLAIVQLDEADALPSRWRLPACPVIGIGPHDHPSAAHLDAIIEPPFEIAGLARSVLAHPHAASVAVQLLRQSRALEIEAALTFESMAYALLQGSGEHAAWLANRETKPVSMAGRVAVERRGTHLEMTIDRPEAGNAIDRPIRDQLAAAFSWAALDMTITSIRLKGKGRTFSLGAELSEFGTTTDPAIAHAIRGLTLPAHAAIGCADRLDVRIDGACVGAGLELAAFAARVTATPRSWFQLPELAMGIIPGAGGCVSLPRRIGRQRTALLVLSGRRIGARKARDWGLIDALVDDVSGEDGGDDIG